MADTKSLPTNLIWQSVIHGWTAVVADGWYEVSPITADDGTFRWHLYHHPGCADLGFFSDAETARDAAQVVEAFRVEHNDSPVDRSIAVARGWGNYGIHDVHTGINILEWLHAEARWEAERYGRLAHFGGASLRVTLDELDDARKTAQAAVNERDDLVAELAELRWKLQCAAGERGASDARLVEVMRNADIVLNADIRHADVLEEERDTLLWLHAEAVWKHRRVQDELWNVAEVRDDGKVKRRLIAVGDVLDADSPEPPVGTVVKDRDDDLWRRFSKGWSVKSKVRGWMGRDPHFDTGPGHYAPLTVVKVGNG